MRSFTLTLTAVLLSCSPPREKHSDPREVVSGMFEAFNKHQWEDMANHYADSASFLDPAFGKTYVVQSREDIVKKYSGFQQAFPDIHDEVTDMYVSGNTVTVEFISTGNAGDGTSFTLPIVSILTIDNGLIVKDATYYDVENP